MTSIIEGIMAQKTASESQLPQSLLLKQTSR
jgi:hypothetical protein